MKLKNIRIVDASGGPKELIFDFENDRHHLLRIPLGIGSNELSTLLYSLAVNILKDPELNPFLKETV